MASGLRSPSHPPNGIVGFRCLAMLGCVCDVCAEPQQSESGELCPRMMSGAVSQWEGSTELDRGQGPRQRSLEAA